MKKVRVLMFFILCFLLTIGGNVYAESVEKDTQKESSTVVESVSSDTNVEKETIQANDNNSDKEAIEPNQENFETESVEVEESNQEEELSAGDLEDSKEIESEKEKVDENQVISNQENLNQEESEKESSIKDNFLEEDQKSGKIREGLEKAEEDSQVLDSEASQEKTEESSQLDLEKSSQEEKLNQDNTLDQVGVELEKGTIIDPANLNPLRAGSKENEDGSINVDDFASLKEAIESTKSGEKKTIIVTGNIEITGTIEIPEGADIVLTSSNKKAADGKWNPIEQPKDYADEGEKKQREIIEEARRRGEKAIEESEDRIDGDYYDFKKEIVLKRFNNFTDTMFNVLGKLTLGDSDSSINFDGNKKEVTLPAGSKGQFFKVNDGAELILKNAVIANGKAKDGYSAAVRVEKGGKFTMEGGRISSNYNDSSGTYPTSAGGVYVSIGGKFNMKNGMIDHNKGSAGAITAGDLYGAGDSVNLIESKDSAAIVNINGGNIINNVSTGKVLAGGIVIFPAAVLNFNDGIIASNESYMHAGGITISDQYVSNYDNSLNGSWVETRGKSKEDYDEYIKHYKAEANFDGGLLYKNKSQRSGGAIFIDSNHVSFNRTMILDNKSELFGGGIYISFPPRVQKLKDLLITENNTKNPSFVSSTDKFWGGPSVGGGIWNCPDGYTHIGDGNSVYVFNNDAKRGFDYCFSEKTRYFRINKENVAGGFYTFISPVTKDGNIIKFINCDKTGEKLPKSMSYTRDFVYLKAVYDKELKEEAWKNSGTFIMGNQSTYGAGIGSDASIETPEDKGDVNFKFKKHWDPSIDKKEYQYKDILLDIYIVPKYVDDVYLKTKDGYENNPYKIDDIYIKSQYEYNNKIYKYGEVILNKYNDWQTSFSDFKKDFGLPFTPQELDARGYKYMVVERDTGYSTSIEESYKEEKNGKIEISRKLSVDYPDIDKLGNPNYYLYYVDEFGRAKYLTIATKDGKGIKGIFSHPILNQKIVGIDSYGEDRNYVEEAKTYERWIKYFEDKGDTESADYYRLLRDLKGHKSGDDGYAFFLKKEKDGLKLYAPYLFIQNWDNEGYSGFDCKVIDNSKEKPIRTYQVDITNRPYTEAKIKKTWKMLTEEEIREALGEYREDVEVKNREIPDQVTFYILKDKDRIVLDYVRDKEGKVYPVYKTVTITKKDGWKGTIDKLDPELLKNEVYGIEEEALEGFKSSYKLTNTKPKNETKDKPTKLSFRLYVKDGYELIEGYDKNDPDYKHQDPTNEYFNHHFGDIKINLLIDGKVSSSKTIPWIREEIDLGEYDKRVFYSMDSDEILFGFDGEEISVYADGKDISVEYYNSMDNYAGKTDYNIYLEKDRDGKYTMYVPNLLKDGKYYQLFQVTERERDSGYNYPPINEFEVNPLAKKGITYTFEVTNEEIPPEPHKPPEEPPHEPPEIPDTPPTGPGKHPKEEEINPEEKPVVPTVEVEETPVVSPKKAGGAPQTGVESVGSYVLIAISSSLGLGYIRRKKH